MSTATERVYRTADGRYVPHGHEDAAFLVAAEGGALPADFTGFDDGTTIAVQAVEVPVEEEAADDPDEGEAAEVPAEDDVAADLSDDDEPSAPEKPSGRPTSKKK